jgi:hypothetical protein
MNAFFRELWMCIIFVIYIVEVKASSCRVMFVVLAPSVLRFATARSVLWCVSARCSGGATFGNSE